jgi:ribosomal-protein-alanine N-acetyltransferase
VIRTITTAPPAAPVATVAGTSDWRSGLPVISAHGVTLRDLTVEDAASLHAHLSMSEVSRFISPPPTTVAGFERFIAWAHAERAAGRYVCFAVVAKGGDDAIGIFQVRQLEPSFATAEWGFALGHPYWGTGVFAAAAPAVVEFAFERLGVRRLEARSSVLNGRGQGALLKIGAINEAVLRKSFLKDGVYHDQILWAINASEWKLSAASVPPTVH